MQYHNPSHSSPQSHSRPAHPAGLAEPQPAPPTVILPSPDGGGDNGSRIVRIFEDITSQLCGRIIEELLSLDAHNPGTPIHMFIYSSGGCIVSGLTIIDTMEHIESPVFTYAIGYAASMGAVILASGQKGHRYILPHSRVMIHQASGSAGGTLENVRATLAFQSELESESGAVLAKATGRQLKEIRDASRVDNWMNASAALEFGLVDHILPASAKAIRHSR
jgi:ATP-dependent Clp protease protease subunit